MPVGREELVADDTSWRGQMSVVGGGKQESQAIQGWNEAQEMQPITRRRRGRVELLDGDPGGGWGRAGMGSK